MKAMVLKKLCNILDNKSPLELTERPTPVPAEDEIFIKITTECSIILIDIYINKYFSIEI